jgi:hypothetical protein
MWTLSLSLRSKSNHNHTPKTQEAVYKEGRAVGALLAMVRNLNAEDNKTKVRVV